MRRVTGRIRATPGRGEEGQAILLLALGALFFVALLAVVMESSFVYFQKRDLQNTADAAALAGVQEMDGTADTHGEAIAAAELWAAKNIPDLKDILVEFPANDIIRVTVWKDARTAFNGALSFGSPEVKASAAARYEHTMQGFGVVILDETACDALWLNSDSNISVVNGGVYVNSSCARFAVRLNSGSGISADEIKIMGGWTGSGYSPAPKTLSKPVPDPFLHVPAPQPCSSGATPCYPTSGSTPGWTGSGSRSGSCTSPSNEVKFSSGSWTLQPGFYNCKIVFDGSSTRGTFQPGVYTFAGGFMVDSEARVTWGRGIYVTLRGGLELNSKARIDGTAGILYYSICPSSCSGGNHDIIFNSETVFDAAPVGVYGGVDFENITIWQQRGSTATIEFNSGSVVRAADGAIYANKGVATFNSWSGTPIQLVAGRAWFNSDSSLALNVLNLPHFPGEKWYGLVE